MPKINNHILSILILIETIIIKLFQFLILPEKYFYDSNIILGIINGTYLSGGSFLFAANFFKKINIFHFTSLAEWSWFISIVFTILIIYYLKITSRYLFIIASVALLNVYVFNLSKDIIQFLIFLLIFFVLKNKKLKSYYKLILCFLIFLYEALNFRIYYGIIAITLVIIYFLYNFYIKKQSKINICKLIFLTILIFFIEIYAIKIISYENYIPIITARSSVNEFRLESINAITIIIDLLGENTNYLIFIGNYLINAIRIMLPIELLLKGIKYIPFIIYQIFISYRILKGLKKINNENILWFALVISFLLVSIIFEPDFGSLIRHEAALTLPLLEIVFLTNSKKGSEKNEIND